MKALTLTQPWAALVAIGAKRIESRSWSTLYRGPLAIHAAKAMPPDARDFAIECALEGWFGFTEPEAMPRGVIVARCRLADVVRVEHLAAIDQERWPLTPQERLFGDYRPGRFAWLLADVEPIAPVPARGRLGLWDWEPDR